MAHTGDPPRRVAVYARVSTDRKKPDDRPGGEDKRAQDPENQLVQLRRYCKEQGWLWTEYVDRESGRKADRENFLRMLADAELGLFDLVLVWKFDRFTREPMKRALGYLEQLEAVGVKFKSYTEPFLDTTQPFADVLFAIFSWMAAQEVEKIRERVKAGLERAKAEGKRLGRRPKHKDRTPEVVADMVRLRAEGKSLRVISEVVGLSRSRICQILKGIRAKQEPLTVPAPAV